MNPNAFWMPSSTGLEASGAAAMVSGWRIVVRRVHSDVCVLVLLSCFASPFSVTG